MPVLLKLLRQYSLVLLLLHVSGCSSNFARPISRSEDPYFQQVHLKKIPQITVIPFADNSGTGYATRISTALYQEMVARGQYTLADEGQVLKKVLAERHKKADFLTPDQAIHYSDQRKNGMIITARMRKLDYTRTQTHIPLFGITSKYSVRAEIELRAIDIRSGRYHLNKVLEVVVEKRHWRWRFLNLTLETEVPPLTATAKELLYRDAVEEMGVLLERQIYFALRGPPMY